MSDWKSLQNQCADDPEKIQPGRRNPAAYAVSPLVTLYQFSTRDVWNRVLVLPTLGMRQFKVRARITGTAGPYPDVCWRLRTSQSGVYELHVLERINSGQVATYDLDTEHDQISIEAASTILNNTGGGGSSQVFVATTFQAIVTAYS